MLEVMTFHVLVGVTLFVDAALLAFLIWAFRSEALGKYRIREPMPVKVSPRAFWTNVGFNGVFSMGLTLALIYGLADVLLTASPTPLWVMALQGVGILVVYDFAYYFMHRGFHIKRVMKLVHGVHHRARYPSALESLYLSPVELFCGLALLMASTGLISLAGPVHYLAFCAAFFVYSTLNIVIHSGMIFPHRVFWLLNLVTRKHYEHHIGEFASNYASITPLPDLLFGTAATRRRVPR